MEKVNSFHQILIGFFDPKKSEEPSGLAALGVSCSCRVFWGDGSLSFSRFSGWELGALVSLDIERKLALFSSLNWRNER